MKKRGISAIIAVILIILIVVVAVAIIWMAILPLIAMDFTCSDPSAHLTIQTSSGHTFYSPTLDVVAIQIKQNAGGKSNLEEARITLRFPRGSGSMVVDAPAPNQARVYLFNLSLFDQDPLGVDVSPIYRKGPKETECPVTSSAEVPPTSKQIPEGEYVIFQRDQCVSDQDCDDGNECTIDTCGKKGCEREVVPDGTPCTRGICDSGVCDKFPDIFFTPVTPLNNDIIGTDHFTIGVDAARDEPISTFIDFDNSLIAWWRMDDMTGSGDGAGVNDKTIYMNDGIIRGDAIPVEGKLGNAISFDGDGDYIELPSSSQLLSDLDEFSISLWFNTRDLSPGTNYLIDLRSSGSSGSDTGLSLFLEEPGTLVSGVRVAINSDSHSSIANFLNDNEWYHVVWVYHSPAIHHYFINGVGGTSGGSYLPSPLHADSATLGGYGGVSGSYNGLIDDVMIFNRELSAEEAMALYANQSSKILQTDMTDLPSGFPMFQAYLQDASGYINMTEERRVTV